MKVIWKYITFFFYNASNWSLWLAFFILYHDLRGAYRYGIRTFEPVSLKKLTIVDGDISKASRYEAMNYYMLEKLLAGFRKLSDTDSIIDLGCGKGRVMVASAFYRFNRITGIDFARELCEEARKNMEKIEPGFPRLQWKVINQNVIAYPIKPDDSVFFMFNPFTEEILAQFMENLNKSCREFPRTTWFLYASPQYKDQLTRRGYELVYQYKILHLEAIIALKEMKIKYD